MNLILEKGRPTDLSGRLEKEVRCYDLLDQLGINYDRVDHEEANTMEACQKIDEVLVPAVICKNLFLCNAGKNKFYLLMIRNDKVFKTTCFLADMGDFATFNGIYEKYFTEKPARSCVAVKELPKSVLCEA